MVKKYNLIIGILAFFIITYIIVRAWLIPLTYDEAWTWYQVNRASFAGIVSYKEFMIANNHVINSLWVKACFQLFGYNVFLFRLLSILGGFLYVGSAYLIVNFLRRPWTKPIFFIVLCFQPSLLDYFSLARGYGLSLGLLLVSFYLTLRSLKESRLEFAAFSSVAIAIALLSNFSLIYLTITLLFINFLIKGYLLKYNERGVKKYSGSLVIILPELLVFGLILLYIYPIGKLLSKEAFLLSSNAGLIKGTLASVLYLMLYEAFGGAVAVLIKVVFLANLAAAVIIASRFLLKKHAVSAGLSFSFILLLLCLVMVSTGIYVQYYFNGVRFPIERGAMYLLIIFFLLMLVASSIVDKNYLYFTNGILAFLFLVVFCKSLTFENTFTWNNEINDKKIATVIVDYASHNDLKSIAVVTDNKAYSIDFYLAAIANVSFPITIIHSEARNFRSDLNKFNAAYACYNGEVNKEVNQDVLAFYPNTKTVLSFVSK